MVALPFKVTDPLAQWLHADSRFHLKDLHIAIIAILVALGSAIGMQIMASAFNENEMFNVSQRIASYYEN